MKKRLSKKKRILIIFVLLTAILLSVIIGIVLHKTIQNHSINSSTKEINVNDYFIRVNKQKILLSSDTYSILVGDKKEVVFTAETSLKIPYGDKINVYCGDILICTLSDDGNGFDKKANDSIFSGSCILESNYKQELSYYALYKSIMSNNIDICYYNHITDEQFDNYLGVTSDINGIENTFMNYKGYVEDKDIQVLFNEVLKYVKSQKQAGRIIDYYYSIDTASITFILDGEITCIFTPKRENVLSGDGNSRIVTLEPSDTLWTKICKSNNDFIAWIDTIANKPLNSIKGKLSVYDNMNFIIEETNQYKYSDSDKIKNKQVNISTLENLGEFSIFVFQGHGGFDTKENRPALVTGEKVTKKSKSDYESYIAEGSILITTNDYFAITPEFIDRYFSKNEGSFVFLGSCLSMKNSLFAESFIKKGASVVIGYNDTVDAPYEALTRSYFFKKTTEKYENTDSYLTVLDAFTQTLSYFNNYNTEKGIITCYVASDFDENYKIIKDLNKEYKLSGVTENNITNNPITDVSVDVIIPGSGSTKIVASTTTNNSGEFELKLPKGTYTIVFAHDDYKRFAYNVTVDTDDITLNAPILLTPSNSIQDNEYMVNLVGITVNELASIYGSDYDVMWHWDGTRRVLYYSDKRTSCMFEIHEISESLSLNGSERIERLEYPIERRGGLGPITKELDAHMEYQDIQNVLNLELTWDELGYYLDYDYNDDINITFFYDTKPEPTTLPSKVGILSHKLYLSSVPDTYEEDESTLNDASSFTNEPKYPTSQKYWVIFKEGFRNDRIEMSTFDTELQEGSFHIIWDGNLLLNNDDGMSRCEQFSIVNNQWNKDREYGILTDWATEIIASNVDIYDGEGNLIKAKTDYSKISMDMLQ